MNETTHTSTKITSPFDSSAQTRLKNMSIIDDKGSVRTQIMVAFSRIFTGLFFDDLRDNYEADDLLAIYETFKAVSQKEAYHHMYLLMSVHYDYMKKALPDPVWWLAGDSETVTAFMVMLMSNFESLMTNEGILKAGEEATP